MVMVEAEGGPSEQLLGAESPSNFDPFPEDLPRLLRSASEGPLATGTSMRVGDEGGPHAGRIGVDLGRENASGSIGGCTG